MGYSTVWKVSVCVCVCVWGAINAVGCIKHEIGFLSTFVSTKAVVTLAILSVSGPIDLVTAWCPKNPLSPSEPHRLLGLLETDLRSKSLFSVLAFVIQRRRQVYHLLSHHLNSPLAVFCVAPGSQGLCHCITPRELWFLQAPFATSHSIEYPNLTSLFPTLSNPLSFRSSRPLTRKFLLLGAAAGRCVCASAASSVPTPVLAVSSAPSGFSTVVFASTVSHGSSRCKLTAPGLIAAYNGKESGIWLTLSRESGSDLFHYVILGFSC